MALRGYTPTPEQRACMDDLRAVFNKHPSLTPPQMLAITAQLVGNLIAFQNQLTMTPDMAMQLVAENIQVGNASAVNSIFGETKGEG
jgi:hypothetical protein